MAQRCGEQARVRHLEKSKGPSVMCTQDYLGINIRRGDRSRLLFPNQDMMHCHLKDKDNGDENKR